MNNINNLKFEILNSQSISNAKIPNKEEGEDSSTVRTILFSAKGKKYTQQDAKRLSQYENLILICGRYEGVDERVKENIVDEEGSRIGDLVLPGNSLAMYQISKI